MLGLTVTLFGTIFLFVNTFPQPPPQPTGQFSAWLTYTNVTGVGKVVATVNIAHLAGPTLFQTPSTQIWIISAAQPTAFNSLDPYTLSSGMAGHSKSWAIGQTWSVTVTSLHLTLPDNLTISIVASSQLLFRQVLPGSLPSIPPQFTAEGTVPASPIVGSAFIFWVQITDTALKSGLPGYVDANYSLIPGFSGTPPKALSYASANGTWQVRIPAGSSTAGTFYVYVVAEDSNGYTNAVAVPVTLSVPSQEASGPVETSLALNVSAPVNNSAATILATVQDSGVAGGTATVTFYANGVLLGSSSASILSGSAVTLNYSWTPTSIGSVVLTGDGVVAGVGYENATLATTVFPPITLVERNTGYSTTKTYFPADEAGWLAAALVADGIPFSVDTINCHNTLPSYPNALYAAHSVLIVDYGSSTTGCSPSTATDQTTLSSVAGAGTISVWVVGSNFWSTTACPNAAFIGAFGLKGPGSGGCATSVGLPVTTGAFVSDTGVGLEASGIASSYGINGTVASNTTFKADTIANAMQSGKTATSWFTIGGTVAGTLLANSGDRLMTLAFDPSMLVQKLPGGQWFGSGAGAAELVYNAVDFLSGITTGSSTNANRQGINPAVSEVQVIGSVHTKTATVYAGVRENGLVGGVLTVTLLINGTPALYGGNVVSTSITMGGGGTTSWVTFTWMAPGAANYAFEVDVVQTGDQDSLNNEFGTGIVQAPITFT